MPARPIGSRVFQIKFDYQTALELLGFASVLFRVLDGATKNP